MSLFFGAVLLFCLVYPTTMIVGILFADDFVMKTKFGLWLSQFPKPFSCGACLSGWAMIIFWGTIAMFAGIPYGAIAGALVGGYIAARHLNNPSRSNF